MFTVTLDASDVIDALENMEQQLKEFPNRLGETLTEWQTEDMRRRYPNTTVTDTYAETDIWPTSRLPKQDEHAARKIIAAHKTQSHPTAIRPKGSSNRPILRPELYEKLVGRVEETANKYLTWETD